MPKTYAGKTVSQRMELCNDLMNVRSAAASLTGAKALAGRVILNQRAAAVRRLLGAAGDVPADPFDDLMSPSSARARLQSMVDELESLPPDRRLAQSERVRDIGAMLRSLADAQRNLGIQTAVSRLPEDADLQAQRVAIAMEPAEQKYSYQRYDAMRVANMQRGAMGDDERKKAADAHQALEQHRATPADVMFPDLVAVRDRINAARSEAWDKARALLKAGDQAGYEAAQAEYDKLYDDVVQARQEIVDAYNAETQYIQGRLAEVGQKQTQRLLDASAVSAEQASSWAEAQEINKTAAARLSKIKYPVVKVRQDMAEFYRLTGGRLNSVKIDSKGDRRANAVGIGHHGMVGTIYLDGDFDKRVLFHEMAHHLESDPAMFKASANYIRAMASSQEPQTLRELTGSKFYSSQEVALAGGFYSPYIGKVYDDQATEVMSMGIEAFAEPWKLGWIAGKDPATIEFVSGALMAPQGEDERMHAKLRDLLASINGEAKQNQANAIEAKWAELAATVSTKPVTTEQAIAWFEENTYYGSVYRREIEKKKITPVCTTIDGGELGDRAMIVSEMVKDDRTGKRLKGHKIYFRNGNSLTTRSVPSKNIDAALAIIAIFNKTGHMSWFVNIDTADGIAKL